MAALDHAPSPRLRRRDVLAIGAGLAVFPAVAWAERDRCAGLAIGYCRAPTADAENTVTPVVAAGRLAAGDGRLAGRGVRVTIHGLLGDTERLPSLGVRSAELKVGFPTTEFRAWSYQLLPVAQFGSPNAFTVPVDQGLALALEVETPCSVSAPAGRRHERFETVLSIAREPGVPKLRAGRYLIAPGGTELRTRGFDAASSEPMIAFSVEPLA